MSIIRRNVLTLMTPLEVEIQNIIYEIEKTGADTKLTQAVILMSQAKDLISDFIDNDASR